MELIIVSSLILGILNIIWGILGINKFKRDPNRSLILLVPFIYAFIFIMGAISGDIWFTVLSLIILSILFRIYTSINPEMKKKQDKSWEIAKKHPLYKFVRIVRYILLAVAIFFSIFILIIVLFNITF